MSESPIIKVVRDTPGPTNNKYHVYGRIGDESKVLQHVKSMKAQIKKWSGKPGISITFSQGGTTAKSRTQAGNVPSVTEESANWSAVTNTTFDMQASITEHGTLLKEKGAKKVATTLIKDCIEEVTLAIESTMTAWKAEMVENLTATKAIKSANKAVERQIKSEYDKLFKTLRSMRSDFARHGQAKHGRPSDTTEGNYVQKITNMLALTTNHF